MQQVAGQKDPLVSLITLPKQYMGDDTVCVVVHWICIVLVAVLAVDVIENIHASTMHAHIPTFPQIRSTGIVIAHGTQPDHKGKLLTELAVALASQGGMGG